MNDTVKSYLEQQKQETVESHDHLHSEGAGHVREASTTFTNRNVHNDQFMLFTKLKI